LLGARAGGGEDRREREREKEIDAAASEWRRRPNRRRTERREGGMDFPKDLCAISENCRDLSVKQNFPSI
jgi:hypothetical protein